MTTGTVAVTLGSGRLAIADAIAVARDGALVSLGPAAAAAKGRRGLDEHGLLGDENLLWRALARRRAAA